MMSEYVTGWDLMATAAAEKSRLAFEARSDFKELVAAANQRGYRRISLHEQVDPTGVDAYTWRGGVWVRNCNTKGQPASCTVGES